MESLCAVSLIMSSFVYGHVSCRFDGTAVLMWHAGGGGVGVMGTLGRVAGIGGVARGCRLVAPLGTAAVTAVPSAGSRPHLLRLTLRVAWG